MIKFIGEKNANLWKQTRKLTVILSESGHHYPGSDPRLQWERPGDPLQLLRIRMDQLREAGVHEGGVLASEGRHGIHRARVHSDETHLIQGRECRLGQVEEMRLGEDFRLRRRRVWGVWMRGGGRLWAAGRQRAVSGAPAVIQPGGRTVRVRPLVHVVRQQRINSKVFGFLHVGCHSDSRCVLWTVDVISCEAFLLFLKPEPKLQ